jgi:hypothetical protein
LQSENAHEQKGPFGRLAFLHRFLKEMRNL